MPKRSQPVLTLTAAAKRINMADPTSAKRDAAKSKPWHAEAWGYFDEVPEIKESIRYRGNQLGKVRLFVAVANPKDPTADPVPVTDPDSGVPAGVAAAATEELARLRSRMGGQAEIMRMLDMNLEVVGEALDVDTVVPTPTGFSTMGDLKPGDQVISGDGLPCTVTHAHPVHEDRECYEVRLTGDIRVVADAEHLWVTRPLVDRAAQAWRESRRDKPYGRTYSTPKRNRWADVEPRVVTTAQMRDTLTYGKNRVSNHAIDTTAIVGSDLGPLPIDPYVLGYWLGDGTTTQGCITVHTDDQPHLRSKIEEAGFGWSPRPCGAHGYSIGILGLQGKLRAAGLLGDKHIPLLYLRHTVEVRWALLQGLIDSDGHVDKRGCVEFSNINQALLWQVAELAASLGLKPGRPARNRITFRSAGQPVALLPRKAERIRAGSNEDRLRYVKAVEPVKSRPVRCITVDSPDGTFLVTERMVRTHNCYLVGYSERPGVTVIDPETDLPKLEGYQPEDWMIRSVSEVEVKGSGKSTKYIVKADPSDTKGVELDTDRDTIMRIWLRHPQWASQADCSMRGLLGECRQLQVLCQQQLAHSYRALSAGILTVPNELMPRGAPDPTKPEEDAEDPLMDVLYEVLSAPISDPTHPSTVQPGLLRGPSEQLKPDVLRWISFYDAAQVQDIEARIAARIARIARGLNLPVEKIMGHQGTTYANAAQVDEDEFNDYLAPSAETAVEALTFAFLTPQLEEAGGEAAAWADRLFVWYDPSDLIAQPDAEKHAAEAFDRNAISYASLRKSFGFGDEDAAEPLELLQRAGLRRGIMTADLTHALLELLGIPIEVPEGGDAVPVEPNAEATAMLAHLLTAGARPRPIRAASRPSSPDYGRRLTEIDRELRTRLLTAANVAMGTALDRAANRLRTKTNGTAMRASLNNVPRRSWFAQLGPSLVAEAMGDEDPLEGVWDGLEDEFRAWGGDAQARARTTAGQAVGGDLSGLEPQQSDDLDGAWVWFAAALTGLAVAKLWTPDPSAPTIGEHDPSVMIPAGMVRQAVARAGGAQGLITGGQDAWVTLTDAGTRPAGGIGTGDLIRGALRDGGATIEGYVWQYGPGFRAKPFDPHERLNGTPFVNFDDDVLASQGEFGWSHYLPGDHSGCLCDVEPTILGVDER